jgi:hypothetical protein
MNHLKSVFLVLADQTGFIVGIWPTGLKLVFR